MSPEVPHTGRKDPRAILDALLDVTGEHLAALMWLVDAVEHQRAIARFGYPKDNAFPERPLEARLQERAYVAALIVAAEEEEEEPDDVGLLALLRELVQTL